MLDLLHVTVVAAGFVLFHILTLTVLLLPFVLLVSALTFESCPLQGRALHIPKDFRSTAIEERFAGWRRKLLRFGIGLFSLLGLGVIYVAYGVERGLNRLNIKTGNFTATLANWLTIGVAGFTPRLRQQEVEVIHIVDADGEIHTYRRND